MLNKIYYALAIIVSLSVIVVGTANVFFTVDSRYAYASRVDKLERNFNKKSLRDEIFQLKLLITQDKLNGTITQVWMNDLLDKKQVELKILMEEGGE